MARQTLLALVEDRPAALDRVTGLLRRRQFRLTSLSIGRTQEPGINRLTLTLEGDFAHAERVARNLTKLVEVIHVEPLNGQPAVRRDLALIKIEPDNDALPRITALCEAFRARLIDVSPDSVIVEVTGDEEKIEQLRKLLEPFGIVEMARSECVAMGRGQHRFTPIPHRTARSRYQETRS